MRDPTAVPVPAAPATKAPASYIIRAEDDPLPIAPRYALNLSALPPEMRSTIPGFELIFHKNQEETPAWVEKMNALIRLRNHTRRHKLPEWTYDGRPNEPPYTCLADAAGTVNDWWALQLGRPLPVYESANNGALEVGLDPRLLELEYLRRAKSLSDHHYFLVPKFIDKDPVRNIAPPQQPLGYADLLIEKKAYQVTDPYTGKSYRWTPDLSAMEGEYKKLFSGNVLLPHTPPENARILADGIEKWGIAYVQLEQVQRPRLTGAHTVAVVGYFCMDEGQTPRSCSLNHSASDWAESAYFIVHDSFGDFPADKIRDASGGSAYRAVRIESIDKAIVFPHSLKVMARPAADAGQWEIEVSNKGGRPVQVLSIEVRRQDGTVETVSPSEDGRLRLAGRSGDRLILDIAARHYYRKDGEPRRFLLNLADTLQTAREI